MACRYCKEIYQAHELNTGDLEYTGRVANMNCEVATGCFQE